jgi:hypothetical protein
MALTQGEVEAVLGGAAVLGAAYLSGWWANRKAKMDAAAEAKKAEQAKADTGFTQSFELTKYIRDQVKIGVAEETEDLRKKLGNLERVVVSLFSKNGLIREAFRDYIEATRKRWGSDPHPLDRKILSLLDDDDTDTKTGAMMDELRQSIAEEDDETAPYDGHRR